MNAAPIRQTLHAATAALPDSATPHLDAEILLAHTLGISRAALLACGNDPLPASARATFDTLIARRAAGEPVAYLTGHAWFFGLDLAVTPAVLIPRPETEGLAEWAIRWVGGWSGPLPPAPLTLLDIGTGSGALALALAVNLPPSSSDGRAIEIHATDISAAALDVARCNADRLGLSDRVTFHQADLVPPVLSDPPAPPVPPAFDLVVANLPYVGTEERANVAPDVLLWEPHVALFAGADGLDAIRRLLAALPGRLNPGAAIGLEIGWQQGAAVTALARAAFPGARVALARDLAGLDRVVTIAT